MSLTRSLILAFLVIFVVSSLSFAESSKGGTLSRSKRHLFSYLRRKFTNFGCRMKHWRTVLDWNDRMVRCVPQCPGGYQRLRSHRYGHYCKPIRHDYPPGCRNRWCTRCKPNWFRTRSSNIMKRCVKTCPINTYTDKRKGSCTDCMYSFCKTCTSNRNCTQCTSPRSLFIDQQGNGNCLIICPSGYVSKYDGMTQSLSCIKESDPEDEDDELDEGCLDRFCVKCKTGFLRLRMPATKLQCVQKCPRGFVSNGGNCRACNDPRCDQCQSSNLAMCDKCKIGFFLLAKSPIMTECVRTCPSTHELKIVNGSAPQCELKPPKVCTIKYCSKCLHSDFDSFHVGCSECKDKYYLMRDAFVDRCLLTCPAGYYGSVRPGTKVKTCLECKLRYCQSCVSATKCSSCYPPFVLDDASGKCKLCELPSIYDPSIKQCVRGASIFSPTTTPPPPLFKIE